AALASLTQKEIADGWLLLFDGKTSFGWTSPNGSEWSIADGMLAPQAGKPGLLRTTTVWCDYDLSLEFRLSNPKTFRVLVSTDPAGRQDDPSLTASSFLGGSGSWHRMRLGCRGGRLVSHTEEVSTLFGGGRAGKKGGESSKDSVTRGHIALAGNG